MAKAQQGTKDDQYAKDQYNHRKRELSFVVVCEVWLKGGNPWEVVSVCWAGKIGHSSWEVLRLVALLDNE